MEWSQSYESLLLNEIEYFENLFPDSIQDTNELILNYSKCILLLSNYKDKCNYINTDKHIKNYLLNIKYLLYNFDDLTIFSIRYGYLIFSYTINKIYTEFNIGRNMFSTLHSIIYNKLFSYIGDLILCGTQNFKPYYNIEYGLSGTLIYLMSVNKDFNTNDSIEKLANHISNIMLKKSDIYGVRVPSWYIRDSMTNNYEFGYFDNSINNGILGCIIALSLYSDIYKRGAHIDKSKKSIYSVIDILKNKFVLYNEKDFLICPNYMSFVDYINNDKSNLSRNEYNTTLDFIIAIYLVGKVFKDDNLISMAIIGFKKLKEDIKISPNDVAYSKFILLERKILIDNKNYHTKYLLNQNRSNTNINILTSILSDISSDIDFAMLSILY